MLAKWGLDLVPGTRCGVGARHPLWGGRMLAKWGLDRCQAPAVGRMDASKQGSRSGARHLLWGGRMLAKWGLDRCQAPAVGRSDASKVGSRSGARHPLRRCYAGKNATTTLRKMKPATSNGIAKRYLFLQSHMAPKPSSGNCKKPMIESRRNELPYTRFQSSGARPGICA